MPRKIILEGTVLFNNVHTERPIDTYLSYNEKNNNTQEDLAAYSEILKATIAQYPNKMLFSIKDTAAALSVSQEFIRKKVSDGLIHSVNLGDRKMISINELARIIYKGV